MAETAIAQSQTAINPYFKSGEYTNKPGQAELVSGLPPAPEPLKDDDEDFYEDGKASMADKSYLADNPSEASIGSKSAYVDVVANKPTSPLEQRQAIATRPSSNLVPVPPSIVVSSYDKESDQDDDDQLYDEDLNDEPAFDRDEEFGDLEDDEDFGTDEEVAGGKKTRATDLDSTSLPRSASDAATLPQASAVDLETGSAEQTGVIDYSGRGLPTAAKCFISYAFFLLGGLVVVFTERSNYYACFHGWQSVVINMLFIPGWLFVIIGDIALSARYGYWGVTIVYGALLALIMGVCFLGSMWRLRSSDADKLFSLPVVGTLAQKLTDRSIKE